LTNSNITADSSGCAVQGVGLRPLACWGCGIESCQGHGGLSLVSVMCYQVQVSTLGCSVVQRRPTQYGVSVIAKPQ